ncbi:MAG TPA: hypothetical protein VE439_02075 [Anaerolineae bacterium]|nr:hypothetical protein [Anaerolineae bacterium]
MKSKLLALICILLIPFVLGACNAYPKEPSQDFTLEFRYGVGAKNILDTSNGKYKKDMVVEESIIIDLELSKEQLAEIREKMIEIHFFNYPDEFSSKPNILLSLLRLPNAPTIGEYEPFSSYYFMVRDGGRTKQLHWDDKYINDSLEVQQLRELIQLIEDMIHSSPEYKELPEPRGGYL